MKTREEKTKEIAEETGWSQKRAAEFANSPVIRPLMQVKVHSLGEFARVLEKHTHPDFTVDLLITLPQPWFDKFSKDLEEAFGIKMHFDLPATRNPKEMN